MKIFSHPNIAIIGAGKIANSFAPALKKAGYKISFIISKKLSSAEKLADKLNIKNFSDSFDNFPTNCNFFIFSIPDSEIEATAEKLSKLSIQFKNSLFVHLSGSLNISVLKQLQNKGAQIASFHIMQTFPSKRIVSIKSCYVSIESSDESVKLLLKKLAVELNLIPIEIDSNKKVLYHLSGVFASNFLVGNLFQSELLLNNSAIEVQNILDLLDPIIKSTFQNIKKTGIKRALSGPVQRGDIKTIQKHLKAIDGIKNNLLKLSYVSQSINLLNLIKKEDYNSNHEKIKIILTGELTKIILSLKQI